MLAGAESDPAFAALMLVPPLESELAMAKCSGRSRCDPCGARGTDPLRGPGPWQRALEALYRKFDAGRHVLARRGVRRTAQPAQCVLRYLTAADDDAAAKLADAHYRRATNMTDMIAGLAALSRMNSPLRDAAFASFYDRFRSDPLVLDKWLALQAGSPLPGTLAGVRTLMRHPAFDIKNPNRVRSLVGTFAGNHLRFHAKDGEGYRFLGETLRLLDGINPQVAARMSGAFENWRRYDTGRQALMRAEIEALSKLSGASANLFEVTTKMLG